MKALALSKEIKGEEDYITLELYIALTDNYQKLGKTEESEETFNTCLSIFDKRDQYEQTHKSSNNSSLRNDRPSIIHRLAISMRLKHEYERAADLIEKVIKIKTRLLGTEQH